MHRKFTLVAIAIILALLFSTFTSISNTQALGNLTITPITWNVIGLDSNDVTAGPDTFPVGARVCNTGTTAATNVTSTFVWVTPDPLINLRAGSYGTPGNPYPVVESLAAGACYDFYYEVKVTRNSAAYDNTARYYITATADGLGTVSTPKPRELYVEHLISQSRNSTTDVLLDGTSIPAGGTMALLVGNTYTIKLVGNTATNGYEQIENYINFPNTIFQINKITTTYTAFDTSSPDPDALKKLYADGCSWVNNPDSPIYRSCTDTGKYGGNITVTYDVKIIGGAGTSQPLNNLIYDFSGSSYHYNADYSVAGRIIAIVDPAKATISKTFSPASTVVNGASTLTFTLNNTNGAALSGANFTDSLPTGMTVASPVTYSTSGCGTPTFAPTAGATSISFSNGTIPANGSCTVNVRVTASAEGTYDNSSNNLFIGTVNTDSHAAASLTVGAETNNPVCNPGIVLASWKMDPAQGTGVPPIYTYKSSKVSSAVAGYSGSGTQTVGAIQGNPINSWAGTGWNASTPTFSTPAYFEITVNTRNFSGVGIAFQYYMDNGQWAKPGDNRIYAFSSADGSGSFDNILDSGAAKGSWQSIANTPASITGSSTTTFRINAMGAKTTTDPLYLDNIVITGCGDPEVTIAKTFTPSSIAVNSTSTLTFTINNQSGVNQTGISFSDTLPTGLTVGSTSQTTCGGTLSTTAPNLISFTGGSVTAASATCTTGGITVTATTTGPHQNVSGFISSSQGGTNYGTSGSAAASLTALNKPQIAKRFSPNPILVGGTSTLTFTITNPNPNDALTGLAFSDNYPLNVVNASTPATSTTCGGTVTATAGGGSMSFSGGTVAAGSKCKVTVNVTSSSAGIYVNTSEVVSATTVGSGNQAADTLTVQTVHPGLSILKKVSTSASGPWTSYKEITNQTQVYYQFTVENKGDVALSTVTVADPALTAAGANLSSCAWGSLPVYDVQTCVVGPVNVVSGSHVNSATASGTYNSSTYTSLPSSATYATAALSISKNVTEASFTAAGDLLHYSYVVTNSGSAALEGPVVVSDDKATDESCPSVETVGDLDAFLEPGDSLTCTATYTVTAADVAAASVTNAAFATAGGVNSETVIKNVVLAKASPTITTLADGTSGVVGTSGTFGDTATLSGGNSPTGTVTFGLFSDSECAVPVVGMSGDGAISGTSASWSGSWTPASAGTYFWKASYAGDSKNNAYTTACGGLNEEIVIGKASPSISTTTNLAVGTVGTTATFGDAATLTGAFSPTGTIDFSLFSDSACTVPVDGMNGSGSISGTNASWSTSWTPGATGTYYWKASYAGDANNNAYTTACGGANEEITIGKASPTITTMTSLTSGTVGTTATFGDAATMSGGYAPTGAVAFALYSDSGCTVPVAGMSGDGSILGTSANWSGTWTPTTVGTYYWKASYTGDINNNAYTTACGGANEEITIGKASPTISTSASPAASQFGALATFGDSATLSGAYAPTGSVDFTLYSDAACSTAVTGMSGSGSITGTSASWSKDWTPGAAGTYYWKASYAGDTNNNAFTTACGGLNEEVSIYKVTPTVLTSVHDISHTTITSAGIGDDVHDYVFVSGIVGTPTGDITLNFYTNDSCTAPAAATSGTIALASASADATAFSQTMTTPGGYSFKASYGGDSNFNSAVGECEPFTVAALPSISVTKTADPDSVPEIGGNVTFTFTISNDGDVPVTITSLVDDKFGILAGDADCQVGTSLAVSSSCNFTFTTSLSGAAGAMHVNTFTAHAEDADSTDVSAFDSATVDFTDVLPSITVTKSAAPSSVPETGGSVKFTFVVSNSGDVPVTITSLTDDKFGTLSGSDDCKVGTPLAAGASCTFDYSTSLSGSAGLTHTNEFTAEVKDVNGNTDSDTDTADVTFTDVLPDVTVIKTASPTSVDETGGNVTFTFEVQNSGTVPVSITSLSDDQFGPLTGDADCMVGTSLAAGASCTFDYSTSLSGSAGLTHTNEFTAEVKDVNGNTDSATDTADVTFTDVLPAVTVTKTANPTSVPETGGNVTFTFVVENSGTVPVSITTLSDDQFGTLSGDPDCQVGTSLAAAASCTFDHTVSLSGAAGTIHTNEFTAQVEDTGGNDAFASDTAEVTFYDVFPDITVTKTADPSSLSETGGSVTFTFVVRNSGSVPVSTISLSDDQFGPLTGDGDCEVGTGLAAGESCTFDYTTTLSGAAGTTHTNEFTAHAEDSSRNEVSASDTADVDFTDVLPSISVTKTADLASVPDTGGDVTYTYTVNNTGGVAVTITSLSDDKFGSLDGDVDCTVGTVLDVGGSCNFEYTTTLAGTAGTTHTNEFTAEAVDSGGNTDSATDTADVSFTDTGTAILGIAKELTSQTLSSAGSYDVMYTFLVRNYGTKDLSGIQVEDDLQTAFPAPTMFEMRSVTSSDFTVNNGYDGSTDLNLLDGTDTLAAGESGQIVLVVRVMPAEAGPFNNSAAVSGETATGISVADVSQNGNDPDGTTEEHDGDPTNNNDPTPVSFTENLFDPPMGIKSVDAAGKPVLIWTMVWINNANKFPVNAVVHDPIPSGSFFTPTAVDSGYPVPDGAPNDSERMGISCSAGTSITTVTTLCYYEGPTDAHPRGQVIWAGTVGPDFGITDPDLAVNAIHITFTLTTNDGVTRLKNTATIDSDLNGNGNTSDDGETNVATASKTWGSSGGGTAPEDPTATPTGPAAYSFEGGLPIPLTGFAPDVVTPLSIQPVNKLYSDLGDFWIEIPSLSVKTTIVGVPKSEDGWNVTWLENQAGWLNGTAFPTWAGNSVITGHVYNSDGKPGPFINLANLKYGDKIIVHAWDQKYVYEVRETAQVLPDEISKVTQHEELPWLTLVTCRGYDASVNSYRFRYLVRAVQVEIK